MSVELKYKHSTTRTPATRPYSIDVVALGVYGKWYEYCSMINHKKRK